MHVSRVWSDRSHWTAGQLMKKLCGRFIGFDRMSTSQYSSSSIGELSENQSSQASETGQQGEGR